MKDLLKKSEVRVALAIVVLAFGLWWLGVLDNCSAPAELTSATTTTTTTVAQPATTSPATTTKATGSGTIDNTIVNTPATN